MSALYYYNDGNVKKCIEEREKMLELNLYSIDYWMNFQTYARFGEDLNAIDALKTAMLQGDSLEIKNASLVKEIYDSSGMKGIWDWLLESELKRSARGHFDLTTLYAITGKKEESLNLLEKEFENRRQDLPRINNDPDFDNIRWEPRFQAIIKKMGLSGYQKRK